MQASILGLTASIFFGAPSGMHSVTHSYLPPHTTLGPPRPPGPPSLHVTPSPSVVSIMHVHVPQGTKLLTIDHLSSPPPAEPPEGPLQGPLHGPCCYVGDQYVSCPSSKYCQVYLDTDLDGQVRGKGGGGGGDQYVSCPSTQYCQVSWMA